MQASTILGAYQAGGLTLIAPDLIHAELGNIVWKKHTLQGLAAADAERIISEIYNLRLVTVPAAELLHEVYRLAVTYSESHGLTHEA